MYIAKERKKSSIKNTGIQYIPGHDDNFVDLVCQKYLPENERILELGGGGLRFAVPAALRGKDITVVDIDKEALNIPQIVKIVNENAKISVNADSIISRINVVNEDIFYFLENTRKKYGLIVCFRVIHFFSPEQIERFFSLIENRITGSGILAISAMIKNNFSREGEPNEFFLNSSPVCGENILYRRFEDTLEAESLRQNQNLPKNIHFIDEHFVNCKAEKFKYEIVVSNFLSTRIVNGYVLKKLNRY
jgi:SAM-dependent methyltransferase